MRMDEHTHGTLRFWRESTPTHDIKFAAGKLQTPGTVDRQRDVVAQRAVSKGRGHDAGHLIAHQFGGPEAPYNLSIQNYQQNQGGGTYWDLEQRWAGPLKSGVGVDVTVREMSRKGEDRPYHRHVSWLETHKDSLVLGEIDFVNTVSPKGRVAEGVAFRIIWRNVSELFGVVSALRRNASQTEAATNMATIHKQNQIFTTIVGATLGSREGTLVLPRRSSGLSSTPNSSQTLRHIAIKATDSALWRHVECSRRLCREACFQETV
jgi:hypothetical protein